ncbi:spore coat CotO family protein [Gracilibacillus caseinilyticus]|uniref:Spore coat CotO family protein n=1 Tax=Gracilibacillus caseinilyticus TaxID=2932256 RepID=A0ABY4ETJ5_9BACI|nr:CotO family spore coat protein [Gracilibacillus caseinilyticus]UOQ46949.1 spore coat CotO family protein [Gracilibacillus caseinilyticus]
MESNNSNREIPRMYIAQPNHAEPRRSMQSAYHSTNYNKPKQPSKKQPKQIKPAKKRQKQEVETPAPTMEKKKFKDMDVKEKVIYFADMPFHVPKNKCQIVTERRKYTGLIEGFQNDMVVLKVVNKSQPVSVPLEQIQEINLVGF